MNNLSIKVTPSSVQKSESGLIKLIDQYQVQANTIYNKSTGLDPVKNKSKLQNYGYTNSLEELVQSIFIKIEDIIKSYFRNYSKKKMVYRLESDDAFLDMIGFIDYIRDFFNINKLRTKNEDITEYNNLKIVILHINSAVRFIVRRRSSSGAGLTVDFHCEVGKKLFKIRIHQASTTNHELCSSCLMKIKTGERLLDKPHPASKEACGMSQKGMLL